MRLVQLSQTCTQLTAYISRPNARLGVFENHGMDVSLSITLKESISSPLQLLAYSESISWP